MADSTPGTSARVGVLSAIGNAMIVALIFWPAGRIDWLAGWAYFGIVCANIAINYVYFRRVNPELIEARTRLGVGTKRWDIVWAACFTPLFCAIFIVAGFDAVRYGWSTMSPWLWLLGIAVFAPGSALLTWAMGVNPFFEKTVRIQTERGHRVIDSGPYRYVRHPGYVGFCAWCLATPLMLGSWMAFVPAVLSIAALVVRTSLEDRTLRGELAGYDEYARRVRYRLLPGVW